MVPSTQMTPQQMDFILFNSSQRHIRYKIIQQLMEKLLLLVNVLPRHNMFSPCKKTRFGIGEKLLRQTIIVPTRTIIHPRLDVIIIRYVQDIPKNVCNRIQENIYIQRNHIYLIDADYDYILDAIERRENLILNGM